MFSITDIRSSNNGYLEINNLRLPKAHLEIPPQERQLLNSSSHPYSYIEKMENIVRVPDLKNHYEEHKAKRKNPKKSPVRTVQKIIKKSKARRKLYLNQATSMPTKAPKNEKPDQYYVKEEFVQKNENFSANQITAKKKKKWPVKRKPIPLQHRKDYYKRNKREDRKDLFIITDLDEIKFLDGADDENIVNTHIKRYW